MSYVLVGLRNPHSQLLINYYVVNSETKLGLRCTLIIVAHGPTLSTVQEPDYICPGTIHYVATETCMQK